MPTRVKVCCISSVAEAAIAIAQGAHAVGLVSAMPSGPGVLDESKIAAIARTIPVGVASFLLTSRVGSEEIIAQQRRCATTTIQICDRLEPGAHDHLRKSLPGIGLVQVIHVQDERALDEAREVAPFVDTILLDSGRPNAAQAELGGTGRVHDWDVSRRICDAVSVPVYLAGGLCPDNVKAAIATVRPFGVDVCSGLRTDDQLDPAKVAAFFEAITEADA
ncbi:MAG: phosphoribosylanthranilate isomerase [Planctomycetota bacterium]